MCCSRHCSTRTKNLRSHVFEAAREATASLLDLTLAHADLGPLRRGISPAKLIAAARARQATALTQTLHKQLKDFYANKADDLFLGFGSADHKNVLRYQSCYRGNFYLHTGAAQLPSYLLLLPAGPHVHFPAADTALYASGSTARYQMSSFPVGNRTFVSRYTWVPPNGRHVDILLTRHPDSARSPVVYSLNDGRTWRHSRDVDETLEALRSQVLHDYMLQMRVHLPPEYRPLPPIEMV